MKLSLRSLSTALLPACALLISSCDEKAETQAEATPAVSLDPYFTASAPADPQPISSVRTSAKPGEQVTVSGLVMGREKPFVEGRAAFVLGDPTKITPCNKMPDDHCKTPWDACCDTPEAKREGTATIQIVGADQRVLKQSIKGEHGLKELSTVTLTGTVDKSSTPEALIINATALHVTE
ncbi:MAG: hypothetical protein EOP87_12165 [Verrucomicrobiaceae bacterium]|nr:MAG: hypothetical protein EOP87_12165 [Verrucomicrobiaceae bacterium]